MLLRVVRGVYEHLPSRASEWMAGVVLFNWGWILLRPVNTFSSSPAYSQLSAYATENTWGVLCLAVGATRLVALIINGSFRAFHHSPHVRAFMALVSCFFWFSISAGLMHADLASTGLAVYPALLALDGYNAIRVAGDARLADEAARRAA